MVTINIGGRGGSPKRYGVLGGGGGTPNLVSLFESLS